MSKEKIKTSKPKPKKIKTPEKVEPELIVDDNLVLLRHPSTSEFYKGKKPNKNPSGTRLGVPYWTA
jgi:hypothetical protein